jgi:hypothetical protein
LKMGGEGQLAIIENYDAMYVKSTKTEDDINAPRDALYLCKECDANMKKRIEERESRKRKRQEEHQEEKAREKFVTVGYKKRNQNGYPYDPLRNIAEDDVVRPENKVCCLTNSEEVKNFKTKSVAGCLTYGNCTRCLSSGPVGMHCRDHVDEQFKVLITNNRMMDAQFISELVGKKHMTAKANQTFHWLRTPMTRYPTDLIEIRIKTKHEKEKDQVEREERIRNDNHKLWGAVS